MCYDKMKLGGAGLVYLSVPLFARFSFGGTKLRGFLDAGFYAGGWLSSWREGTTFASFAENSEEDNPSGILYGRYWPSAAISSFMLTEHVGTGDAVDQLVANYHDLLDNYPTVNGVIIEVRHNGGGYWWSEMMTSLVGTVVGIVLTGKEP